MCRLQGLPDDLQNLIQEAVNFTETNQGLTLNVAFNYTGRAEIIDAVNKLIELISKGVEIDDPGIRKGVSFQ
jgi:undecaprenyl diphosphate synthase